MLIIKHEIDDLFNYADTHMLCHCIARDFRANRGIAKEFNKRYNLINTLNYLRNNNLLDTKDKNCIIVNLNNVKICNLITKNITYNKPTYETFSLAITELKNEIEKLKINKIAMPGLIGCGLDRLDKKKVHQIVYDLLKDLDLEIIFCYLKNDIINRIDKE